MTRSLGNGTVDVELGTGSWSARWPAADVHAGPFGASIDVDGIGIATLDAPGTWNVRAGSAFGRPGAWARWSARDGGIWLRLHIPAEGPLLVVDGGIRGEPGDTPGALILAAGPFTIGSVDDALTPSLRRLRGSTDEPRWSHLDEDPAPGAGREALIVATRDGEGAAFGIQALHGAEPVGTVLSLVDGPIGIDGSRGRAVRIAVRDPARGRSTGEALRSEAVAFGADPDAPTLAASLAALASRASG
ncbi:MAG: hypothetical protein JWL73_3991 [Actinomycetia bacterium]|nr:hypothetical protein [Actinomycetes bacterium]